MSDFHKVAFIICAFVMIREFRPVEPFFTSYLTSPPLNFTTEIVNEKIYPIGTYASCSFAIVLFLITDYLRYKPVIILDAITGILTYLLLFGKPELSIFYVEQLFYGFFYSSDVACNTYLYAKVEDSSLYQKITGYVRASSLLGKFISGIFAQSAVSFRIFSKSDLVYFSTGGMVLATLWSFFVPSVDHSIYFHTIEKKVIQITGKNDDVEDNKVEEKVITIIKSQKLLDVGKRLVHDFRAAYTNIYVLKWSLWWAFALCGFFFVNTYSQVLWQITAKEHNEGSDGNVDDYLMNGAVDSTYTILSALGAYLISQLKIDWKTHGDWILSLVSFSLALIVVLHYWSHSLLFIYPGYITFGLIFQTMLTIAQSEVAQNIEKDSYALIFGFNTFAALGLGCIITYTVIGGNLIYLSTREQFLFYGAYFTAITIFFVIVAVISATRRWISAIEL
ncbi:thiamine transporter 1-like isoform X2 [Planococcus citri]